MRRPIAPLWLTLPSRFASMSQARAREVLALLLLILTLATGLTLTMQPAVSTAAPGETADVILYDAIVDGVRNGGGYYAVAADAMRAGGYPSTPFVAMQLPTLAVTEAALPSFASLGMLYALAAATMVAWYRRLLSTVKPPALAIGMVLALCGLFVLLRPGLIMSHEIWAGLFVALSLALRRPGYWVESVAFGLAAVLVAETAAPYLLMMAVFAWAERNRREALAWIAALAVTGVVLLLHAHAVAFEVRPSDLRSQNWVTLPGLGTVVRAIISSTALGLLPPALAAPLVVLAFFGWTAWRDPLALRMSALLAGYTVLFGMFGRLDTSGWALLIAPVPLVGLVFAVDGLRDLIHAARDSRRITVRRIIR